MKYYLIAGEASGDLHAAHLMEALKRHDGEAEFRFFGGDMMTKAGGTRVKHYKELAYMGLIPVLMHLPTILRNMELCKRDIVEWGPDAVIMVDYAGFNLKIASFLTDWKRTRGKKRPAVYYYISPKIWAWKERRIKNFKRDVDELFAIMPFEKQFFEGRHGYKMHYVGNPTADEVREFKATYKETRETFCERHGLDKSKSIIALLAGSRQQEVRDNMMPMLQATEALQEEYNIVVAGAPSIEPRVYEQCTQGYKAKVVTGETYAVLNHSSAALVTSGTATLETCLFNVPQVVCYKTTMPGLTGWLFDHFVKVKYISLVNLVADKEVVKELFANRFSMERVDEELRAILPATATAPEGAKRRQMMEDYKEVRNRLGDDCAPDNTAKIIVSKLSER